MGHRILPSPAEFEDLVRDALLHLYDAAYLLRHPLTQLVDAPAESSAAVKSKRLLQAMLDAIQAFRPSPGTPADDRAWRHYHLLEHRYVGGVSAGDVMVRLDISKSQYQRDHAAALETLALLLWERWRLGHSGSLHSHEPASRESLALSEAADLVIQMSPSYVDLAELLGDLLSLLQPIAIENRITLSLRSNPESGLIYGDRVALRLAFLGLLNLALGRWTDATIDLCLAPCQSTLEVTLIATPASHAPAPLLPYAPDDPELEVSRRLVRAMGGALTVESLGRARSWRAKVALPIARQPIVLVVDNHPDFVDLVTRYLVEHNWQIASASDVGEGQRLAEELRPSVILLDVMIPGRDGWDLLIALRANIATRHIPVIICSVLYEPQVARALGAVNYLAKPFSQSDLLEALAPHYLRKPEPGSID